MKVGVPDGGGGEGMPLDIVVARRFTLADVRGASASARLQLLHGLRPREATLYTVETMDQAAALGVLYDFVDLGPGDTFSLPPHQRTHKRSGLMHLRVRSRVEPQRAFEGWFWDKQRHPSARATPRDGRLFLADTVTPTGVYLERARLRIEPRGCLPDALALAAGFDQLLRTNWRVAVAGRRPPT